MLIVELGKSGENATADTPAKGGYGGYAGIHVPQNASLNLSGGGIITALSGDAGDGGDGYGHPYGGGGRWWSWSWNWWKWW